MGKIKRNINAMKVIDYIRSHEGCSSDDLRNQVSDLTEGQFRALMAYAFEMSRNLGTPVYSDRSNKGIRHYYTHPPNYYKGMILDYITDLSFDEEIYADKVRVRLDLRISNFQISQYLHYFVKKGVIVSMGRKGDKVRYKRHEVSV